MSEAPPPIRALVVDDDPVIVALLRAFLARRGYEVQHCEDGVQALELLRGGDFNLVVTDRSMPRMDGLELSRALRALPLDAYVYSIMLTASSDQAALVAAMEAGVDDFVGKPVNLSELGARLRAAERVLSLEARLARRNEELQQAYGQLRSDLELARVLQVNHLPPPGSFGPLRFDWRFEASGYVGGDTFDYFTVGDRHLCFYLADVAGHGVAAAMMAFHAQHQVRASSQRMAQVLARRGADLAATAVGVASESNRRFLQMNEPGLYLTMVLGLVDLRERQVALVHCGHPPALFAPPGGAFAEVGTGGVPVGILEEPGYEAQVLDLPPGSRLVLYSDGITECRDAQDRAFGHERLVGLLREHAGAPLEGVGAQLQQALRGWRAGAGFEDDVTFLALEAG